MDNTRNLTQRGLTRTGKGAGCSCCSFAMLGLLALPLLAVVSLFVFI
ncbi:MAG TPA: hypothetical protein VJ183_08625 [Chloroflexia bacterium]|nr:hypothetical protein [Chloroflexia bacterium]